MLTLRSEQCNAGKTSASKTQSKRSASSKAAAAADVYTSNENGRAAEVVHVGLGERSYPIYIGNGVLNASTLEPHVKGKATLLATNSTVAQHWETAALDAVCASARRAGVVQLPDGEEYKTIDSLNELYNGAIDNGLDRSSVILALGGGVVGDVAGFAAATYQRGVPYIQVPTTVMAMVDSSVGGKTAVNHPRGKNMIGAFYQPSAVIADMRTLTTLPRRELASGIAEIVKYGLIRDKPLFEWLESNIDQLMNRDEDALAYAIKCSCINKAEVVQADEKEANLRAILNFGHTFGHAIETGTGYSRWLHGEAVAAGMMAAIDMSARMNWIDHEVFMRTKQLLERAELPTGITATDELSPERFKELMAVDKKASQGQVRLILLQNDIGDCIFTGEYNESALSDTLNAFCKN